MKDHSKSVAIVTGAASGIGRELATLLAVRGYRLALADIDALGLDRHAENLRKRHDCEVQTFVVDLARAAAVKDLAGTLHTTYGQDLALLINNAGIALGGSFDAVDEAAFDACMQINFGAPVQLVRSLLPALEAGSGGWIVNVSSIFGIVAPPRQTAYSASKFALRGFSEALTHELADNRNIGVTTVFPGGVKTGIAKNARVPVGADPAARERQVAAMEKKLTLAPQSAAELILDAVDRRSARVLVGKDARLAEKIQRLLPGSYWKIIGRST
tara:strand:+ start:89 stop:904 length:816 start_codon:yes stop_codon:yes gene_type:complete